MNYFAKNLKYLREKHGMEQIDLAVKLGRKSASTISEWEKGKYTPKSGTLSDIAELFGVSLSDLMQKDLTIKQPSNVIDVEPDFVKIPILGNIACGSPIFAAENFEGYTYETSDSLPTGNVFALIAKGDSMEPTIPNGAIVLIRKQPDVENGEIAAVRINEDSEVTLKRVKKENGSIWLIPDNPKHPFIQITNDNPATIIGKAISYKVNL